MSDAEHPFGPRYSPNTPEGEIEGAHRFSRGLRDRRRGTLVALFVVVGILIPAIFTAVAAILE